MLLAGGLFEGGLFDDAPMGEVSSVAEPSIVDDGVINGRQSVAASRISVAASVRDDNQIESDDDLDDRFGGPPSMGGQRYTKNPHKLIF